MASKDSCGNAHRCLNCGLKLARRFVLVKEQSADLQNLLKLWILEDLVQPTEITDTDHLCIECHTLLLQALEEPEKLRFRQLGHYQVCIVCGLSLLRARSVAVFKPGRSPEEWRLTAKVTATLLGNRKLAVNTKVCYACWMKIDRSCQKITPKPTEGLDLEPSKSIKTRNKKKPKCCSSPEPDSIEVNTEINTIKVEMPDPLGDVDCTFKTEINEDIVNKPNEDISLDIKIEYDYNESLDVRGLQSSYVVVDKSLEIKQDIINELYDEENNFITETNNLLIEIQSKKERKMTKYKDEKEEPGTILLSNLRRASASSSNCVFKGCKSSTRCHIPLHVRSKVLRKHNYFLPYNSRICVKHLEQDSYEDLYESRNSMKLFTAAQVEEMVGLLVPQTNEHIMDYEHARYMPEYLLEYWTGIPTEMFMKILHITGLWHHNSMYLVALLCKLRTDDSVRRMAKLFKMSRTSLLRKLTEVRKALIDHSECITMLSSIFRNKYKMKVFTQFFSDEPHTTEEERAKNRIKYERRRMKLAALAAAKESGTRLNTFSFRKSKSSALKKPKASISKKSETSYFQPSNASTSSLTDDKSSSHELSSSLDQSKTTSTQFNTPSLNESNVSTESIVNQSVQSSAVICTSLSDQWNKQPDPKSETSSLNLINNPALQNQWGSPPPRSNAYESNLPIYVNGPTLDQWNSSTPVQLNTVSSMLNQWNTNEVTPTYQNEMNIPSSIIEVDLPKLKKAEIRSQNYIGNSATPGSSNETTVIPLQSHTSKDISPMVDKFDVSSAPGIKARASGYMPNSGAVSDIPVKRKRGRPLKFRRDLDIT